jgi:hypothetical protein
MYKVQSIIYSPIRPHGVQGDNFILPLRVWNDHPVDFLRPFCNLSTVWDVGEFKAACDRRGRITNFQQWIWIQNSGISNCHIVLSKRQSFSAMWSVVMAKCHVSIASCCFGLHSFYHTLNHNALSLHKSVGISHNPFELLWIYSIVHTRTRSDVVQI